MKKVLLIFSLIWAGFCCYSCTELSDSSLESKLKGDWVASDVIFLLNGQSDSPSYYNGLVYSLSFKDNNTVEVATGEYSEIENRGWKLNGDFGNKYICNYYINDGAVHVGVRSVDKQFIYENGMLVLTEQEREPFGLEETIVHYKKK